MTRLTSLCLENFVAFQQPLDWRVHSSLNVIIGVNDTGKTHLLKLLYAMTRSVEEFWKKQIDQKEKEELVLFIKNCLTYRLDHYLQSIYFFKNKVIRQLKIQRFVDDDIYLLKFLAKENKKIIYKINRI